MKLSLILMISIQSTAYRLELEEDFAQGLKYLKICRALIVSQVKAGTQIFIQTST